MKSFFDLLQEDDEGFFLPPLSYEEITDLIEQDFNLLEIDQETGDNVLMMVTRFGDEETLKNFCYAIRNEKSDVAQPTTWLNNRHESIFFRQTNKDGQNVFDIAEYCGMIDAIPFEESRLIEVSQKHYLQDLSASLFLAMHQQDSERVRKILALNPPLILKEELNEYRAYDYALATMMPPDILNEILESNRHYNATLSLLLKSDLNDKNKENIAALVDEQLMYGANPNHKDEQGNPILNQAITSGNQQAVEALLSYGANPFLTDSQNRNSLQLAAEALQSDQKNIVRLNIFNKILDVQISNEGRWSIASDSIKKLIQENECAITWIDQMNLGSLMRRPELKNLFQGVHSNEFSIRAEIEDNPHLPKPEAHFGDKQKINDLSNEEPEKKPSSFFKKTLVSAFLPPKKEKNLPSVE